MKLRNTHIKKSDFEFLRSLVLSIISLIFFIFNASGQTTETYSTPGTFSWTVPSCVTSITVEAWGAGGGGGGAIAIMRNSSSEEACAGAGGGGGGGYSTMTFTVIPGQTYTIVVGAAGTSGASGSGTWNGGISVPASAGGTGGTSSFSGNGINILATGGTGGGGANIYNDGTSDPNDFNNAGTAGTGGSGSGGTTNYSGGNGAAGLLLNLSTDKSGGGGGAAGPGGNGGNAPSPGSVGPTTDPPGGTGQTPGGNGGTGKYSNLPSNTSKNGGTGNVIGGAGGGGLVHRESYGVQQATGGAGERGEVKLTYTVPAAPTASITNNTGLTELNCTITSIDVTASATGGTSPYTYSWSGGDTPGTDDNNFTTSGTYIVTVTDNNGCPDTEEIIITQDNATPLADAGTAGNLTCTTTSLSLSGTGGGTYNWSTSDGHIVSGANTATPNIDAVGTYTVTVTAANGCTAEDNVTVAQDITAPTADAGTSPGTITCLTTSLQLSGSGGGTYSWATITGNIVSGANTATPTIDAGGAYGVTVTGANGCTASDFVSVSESISAPDINVSGGAINCTVPTTNLFANGGGTYSWSTLNGNIVSGSNTATPTVDAAGTYTVTVTSAINGCTSTGNAIVTANITPPAAEAGTAPGTLTCTTTSLQLSGSGGGTYAWSGGTITAGANTATPTVTAPATYSVTVTAANGCTAEDNVVITQDIVSPTAGITNISGTTILNCATTSINLNANGGGTYAWSGGLGTNAAVSVNTPTTYTVTVTAANGCTDDQAITITEDIAPPTAYAGADQSVCPGDGITITATGGGTYAWSSGDNTASTTVTPAGTTTYVVTVTAANGCIDTDDVQVTVGSSITANAGTDQIICRGDSVTLTATGGSTYLWSNSETTSSITVSPNLTITYTVTVSTGNCSATDNVEVTVYSLPDYNLTPDQILCSGNSVNLTANTTGGSYDWSTGETTGTINVSPSSTTTYTVTITGSNGCSRVDSVEVTVNAVPIANAGTDVTICNGDSVMLIATGGSLFLWSDGTNNDTTTVNPSSTMTYTVSVSSTGCTASDDITVNVNAMPAASAGNDLNICSGDSVLLIASGGDSYLWDNNSVNDSISVMPSFTTTYSVTVESSGCSASDNVTITVNTTPVADAGNDTTICSSLSITLTASGGGSYSWSSGDNTASSSVSPVTNTTYYVTVNNSGCTAIDSVTVNVNTAPIADAGLGQTICNGDSVLLIATGGGTYLWSNSEITDSISVIPSITTTFTVTVTDNGCSASDNVTVTVNPIPSADAGNDQALCDGESAILTATGGGSYAWNNGAISASINVTPSSTTLYYVTVTNNGCTASDSIQVTVNPNPVADAGTDQSICGGGSVTLSASGGGNYQWSNSETTYSIDVAPSATTTYTVTVTINGCTDTDDVTVSLYPNPEADAGTDQGICEGLFTAITASGGGSYLWNTGDTSASFIDAPIVSTTYSVTVTNEYGCTDSDDVTVTVYAIPTVMLSSEPEDFAYVGQIVTFIASPDGYSVYNFYLDSVLVQSGSSNVYQNNTLTNGQVVSVTVGDNGCNSDIDTTDMEIKPIPNAFTPDGNGKNDVFVPGLDLTIINRWDQILYEGNEGWDGKYNNKYSSPGTYYYIIRIPDLNNNISTLTGSVTLIDNKN